MTTAVEGTKAQTVTRGRRNAISGFDVSKLDRVRILKACESVGVPGVGETTEQIALALFAHYEALPLERKIRCDTCHGIGDQNDDECPYCGATQGTMLVDEQRAKEGSPVQAEVQPIREATTMTTAAAGTEDTKKKKTNGASKSTALAKDDTKASSEIRTERELDVAVNEVQILKGEGAAAAWRLGAKIAEIHTAQLWKLRSEKKENGDVKPRWSTFEAFCNTELNMTPKNATLLMDVANNYTIDKVKAFGPHKLGLMLQAPPEDRPDLEDKLKKGATHRELKKEVQKVKKAKGYTRESRAKDGRGGASADTKKREKQVKKAQAITVANIIGTETVKLYKKPATLKDLDFKALTRAKRIGDQPFGRHELSNGVVQFYTVQETPAGELVLKIVTQRDE